MGCHCLLCCESCELLNNFQKVKNILIKQLHVNNLFTLLNEATSEMTKLDSKEDKGRKKISERKEASWNKIAKFDKEHGCLIGQ